MLSGDLLDMALSQDKVAAINGRLYSVVGPVATVPAGQNYNMAVAVLTNGPVYFIRTFQVLHDQGIDVRFYENAAISGGTVIEPTNNNRRRPDLPNTLVHYDPTITVPGDSILTYAIRHYPELGAGNKSSATELATNLNFIPKPGTMIINVNNFSASPAEIQLKFVYQEL